MVMASKPSSVPDIKSANLSMLESVQTTSKDSPAIQINPCIDFRELTDNLDATYKILATFGLDQ